MPPLLEPTKIFPASLSAICLGVFKPSANISIENPFSISKFWISLEESENIFKEKDIITKSCK